MTSDDFYRNIAQTKLGIFENIVEYFFSNVGR